MQNHFHQTGNVPARDDGNAEYQDRQAEISHRDRHQPLNGVTRSSDLRIVCGNQDFGTSVPEDFLIENIQGGSHIGPDDPDPCDDQRNQPGIEQTAHLRHDLRQV